MTLRDMHSAPEGMAANVVSSAGEAAGGAFADDEEYLDLVADRALAAVSESLEFDLAAAIAERPHLAERIREVVALTQDVAVRGAPKKARIGGYEIERELGRGGMGTVFLARQVGLGRRIALKVLPGTSRLSERSRQRFLAEAQSLGKLGHPHVVSIHEVIETPEACAFAMEWVEGSDLQRCIDFRRVDPTREMTDVSRFLCEDGTDGTDRSPPSASWSTFVAGIGIAIARALGAAHRAGLLHRDVKPSNILLRKDGTPLLSDFGLARDEESSRQTLTGAFVGTLAYASPEQIRGEAVDARSDVYSLGVTLYHALGLELPFRGASPEAMLRRIEYGIAQPLRAKDARIRRDLATIVGKAMEVDAARRYSSADALADDLERFLRHEPIVAVPDALATRVWKFVRRNRRTVVAATLATLITTVIAVFAIARYLDWKERPARAAASITGARLRLADPESRARAAHPSTQSLRTDAAGNDDRIAEALALYDAAIDLAPQPDRILAEREAVAGVAYGVDYTGSDERAAGIGAFLSGKSQAALDRWTEASIDGPVDPLVEVFLAQWKLEHGEPAAAYAHLLRVESAWPDAMFVRLDLADAALQLGDVGGAEQWLAPLSFHDCAGDVSKRILLRLHSEVAEANGDLGLAEALDQILATRYGATTQSSLGHARRLARLGRPWEAIEILHRLSDRNPRPPTWERDAREILVAAARTLTRADLARWIFGGRRDAADPVPDLGTWFSVLESVSANGEESAALDLDDSAPNPHGVSLRDLDRLRRATEMSRGQPRALRILRTMNDALPDDRIVARTSAWVVTFPKVTTFALIVAAFVTSVSLGFGQTEVYRWEGDAAGAYFGYNVSNAGDVDNDGFADVVIGAIDENALAGSSTVRSGRTGAVIHKWFGITAGDQFGHSHAAMGDLDGDGFDDVAVGVRGNDSPSFIGYVRVFSGQWGTLLYTFPGFQAGSAFGRKIGNLGDVNGDGTDDLGVLSAPPNYVKIYSGATGAQLHHIPGGGFSSFLGIGMARLGDLDEDGSEDFALGDFYTNSYSGSVTVYSGQTASALYTLNGAVPGKYFGAHIANVGDIDADGEADLAVGAAYGSGLGTLFVYSGQTGALLLTRDGETSADRFGASCALVADADADGIQDIAVTAPGYDGLGIDSGRVYVLSAVTLDTVVTVDGDAAGDYLGINVGGSDLTGDGEIDVLVGAPFNNSAGTDAGAAYVFSLVEGCSTSLPHYSVGLTPRDVLLVDRDGDGDRDAVTANNGAGTLTVLTNDGQGDFSATTSTITLGAGDDPQSIVAQGTGLAVACPSTNAVRQLAASAGSWTYSGTTLTPPGQRPVDLASGDLDGAGGIDLAIALEGSVFGIGGGVAVSLGGAPAMLAAPPGGFLSMKRVAIGDLDGDGDQDLVAGMTGTAFVAGPSANVLLYENDGSGTFNYAGALTGGGVPSGFALRNLDGDSDVDLMVIAQAVPPFGTTSGLTVFKNDGTGALGPARFTALTQLASGSLPGDVVSLDLNSDSLPGFIALEDVVVADTIGSMLKGFRSFGSTSFASTEDLEADDTPVALAAGDLNADGIPDLVAVNAGCDAMTVSLSTLNALTQKFGTGCAGTAGKVPAISAVGSPTFGNPSFGVKLTNGRAASFVFFGISLNYLNAPLGGGCSLYLTPPVAFYTTFSNALGESQFHLGIPNAVPPFVGLNAYFQYFVNDPVGGYSGFAFSDALRIRLGI